ncbi:MAG: hypothetical protein ACI9WU_001840 [Myxococcota bacterium]|jgi:uncharacterized protein (DUF362 family)
MSAAAKPRVIIRHCEDYDVDKIQTIVREAMEELDLRPTGRTLVKPNIVIADDRFPFAYTRCEVTDGILGALKERDEGGMTELAVGERCGITVPTRYVFHHAGYNPVIAKHGAKRYCFDEVKQVEIPLRHPQRLRDYVYTPEPVARADFFVNVPKFKAHPWTTVTFSMKNYIGIQDDRHRLIDHDHRLNDKIADLQEILQPQLIVIDAIVAGQDRMLTPVPFDMKLLIIGNNQPAFDAICSRIIGLNPHEIEHLRLGHERGYGPLDVEDIEITGDVTLEEAQARAKGFRTGLIRVEDYFEGTKIKAYAGPPPEKEHTSYCWGGCPGAMEESIEIIRQLDAKADETMKPFTVVFGAYEGKIEAEPGAKVIFMGDCCNWKGDINGQRVSIDSLYKERKHLDPRTSRMSGIYSKLIKVMWTLFKGRKNPVVRVRGCPVSVAEQTMYIANVGKTKNPYLDPSAAVKFNLSYAAWKMVSAFRKITGKSYQGQIAESDRGGATHGLPAGLLETGVPTAAE